MGKLRPCLRCRLVRGRNIDPSTCSFCRRPAAKMLMCDPCDVEVLDIFYRARVLRYHRAVIQALKTRSGRRGRPSMFATYGSDCLYVSNRNSSRLAYRNSARSARRGSGRANAGFRWEKWAGCVNADGTKKVKIGRPINLPSSPNSSCTIAPGERPLRTLYAYVFHGQPQRVLKHEPTVPHLIGKKAFIRKSRSIAGARTRRASALMSGRKPPNITLARFYRSSSSAVALSRRLMYRLPFVRRRNFYLLLAGLREDAVPSYLVVGVPICLNRGFVFVSRFGCISDSDPVPILVFDLSPVPNFDPGPAFDSDPDEAGNAHVTPLVLRDPWASVTIYFRWPACSFVSYESCENKLFNLDVPKII
ncbi:hypothetical protein EVAR_94203_1 [Eumeta japonica]|uniref:Uncharacterized protein n=1 Tax=Eumeta variegata TaxID=151549 RepID=A0A4C1UN91_EUMVA|nr:hypothetical protein EVAR_94203_1 [Eumeta japonica]